MAVRKKTGEIFLLDALKDLCKEKEISQESMFSAIEAALIFACKKTSGADKNITAEIDRESGAFKVKENYNVVKKVQNPAKEIALVDARRKKSDAQIGDVISKNVPQRDLGRIAAQAAKQVVMQKIREAERISVYDEFADHANDIVNGDVIRIEDGNLVVDIGKTEAVLEESELMPNDNFEVGDRIKAYVAEVHKVGKGPQIFLSRTHPNFLRKLFELGVPEIQEGIIEVKSVAREPGVRSKIAVYSKDKHVEAIGSCVGEQGARIQTLVEELGDEKIDVVLWNEDAGNFIANALSPAKVMRVAVNDLDKMGRVVVPNNQLSLAIGKEGQNARLAAKLTGWKIDIKSKSQSKNDVLDSEYRIVKVQPARFFSSLVKPRPKKPKLAPIDENLLINNGVANVDENVSTENVNVDENVSTENTGVNVDENVSTENVSVNENEKTD